ALAEAIGHAEALAATNAVAAASIYKDWIALHGDDPLLHAAYFNYGVALSKAGDQLGAINATRESLRIKPDFPAASINLGRLLEDIGQKGEAVTEWLGMVNRLGGINGDTVKN